MKFAHVPEFNVHVSKGATDSDQKAQNSGTKKALETIVKADQEGGNYEATKKFCGFIGDVIRIVGNSFSAAVVIAGDVAWMPTQTPKAPCAFRRASCRQPA